LISIFKVSFVCSVVFFCSSKRKVECPKERNCNKRGGRDLRGQCHKAEKKGYGAVKLSV
jgi:hypothetical protein